MESSRVTCTHCDFLFYPEEGVSLDDCPVCGRTVDVKPAPAPQPGMAAFVALAEKAADNALEVIAQLRAHISDLTLRLAEAEQEACEALAGAHAEQEVSRHWKEEARWEQIKRKCAEARGRELEATIGAMVNEHAHDDMALTAAYLSGAHAGKKQAEAFKTRVMAWARGRCGACEHEGSEDDTCYNCQSDYEQSNWTLPQALEVGE